MIPITEPQFADDFRKAEVFRRMVSEIRDFQKYCETVDQEHRKAYVWSDATRTLRTNQDKYDRLLRRMNIDNIYACQKHKKIVLVMF